MPDFPLTVIDLASTVASAPVDTVASWWPAWVALAVSGLIAINRAIEESSKFASVLGKWAVKINQRARKRHQLDVATAEIAAAVTKAVEDARTRWTTNENEALAALDMRLEAVAGVTKAQREDLDELRFQVRALSAYTEYEASWHRQVVALAMASPDGRLHLEDMPQHLTFYDFEPLYRKNPQWRDWGR